MLPEFVSVEFSAVFRASDIGVGAVPAAQSFLAGITERGVVLTLRMTDTPVDLDLYDLHTVVAIPDHRVNVVHHLSDLVGVPQWILHRVEIPVLLARSALLSEQLEMYGTLARGFVKAVPELHLALHTRPRIAT